MDISEEEFNKQHLKHRKKEENNMGLKIVKPKQRSKAGVRQPRGWRSVKGGAQKGKAGKAKEQWFKKGGKA